MSKGIPEIRFKGFKEIWGSFKLGDISEIRTGPFGSTLHAEDYVENGTPIITTEHFKNGYLPINKKDIPQVSDEDYTRLNSYILDEGDIVFSRVGSVDINALVKKENEGWLFSGRVLRVRLNKAFDAEYIHHLLDTTKVKNNIITRAVGQTMPSINTEILKETPITITLLKEQQKIGIFLKKLDYTISLQQQLVVQQQQYKKAMLQKMFPQKGERVPKVRFDGFSEKWEKRQLGEVSNITTGKLDANAMKENGQYDFYTSGIQKYKIDIAAFKGPAITIAGNGATVGYMHYADGEFNAYQRTYVLTDFKADRRFLFSEIENNLPKKINREARAGSIPYIVKDMLTDLHLLLPSHQEQQKIGVFFKQLDDTIALYQKKLEDYQQLKKALLQRMFV